MPIGREVINPATGQWRGDTEMQMLRAIYLELRLLNRLIADGLNVGQNYEDYRNDTTSLYPDADDGDA